MIEAVIFDLDGTLVNIPIDYKALFKKFSEIMKTETVRPLTETIAKLDSKTRRKIFRAWDGMELAVKTEITPIDQGIRLYEEFSEKTKGLVTMQGKALVGEVLESWGLFFDTILTREDCLSRVEQLRNAAERLDVRIESVLFIGDEQSDLLASKQVGCQFRQVKK